MTKTTRRFAIGAGILLGVGVVFLTEEHIRGAMELHAWQRAMRAKGEKLTIAELTPPLTNLASRVIPPGEAAGLLGRTTPPQEYPTAMQIVAPGKARIAWAQSSWRTENRTKPYGMVTNDWNESGLAGAFKSLREALPALRSDLTNRAFVVSADYDQGFELLLPHLAKYKQAAQALSADTVLALHEHRLDEATENLVAGAALVRLMKNERILISHLVRIASAAILQGAMWEALQADGWTDAQLQVIQAGWEPPDFMEGMVQAYGMERAMGCTYFDSDRYSNRKLIATFDNLQQFTGSLGNADGAAGNVVAELLHGLGEVSRPLRATVHIAVWRVAWADQDQLCYCESVQRVIDCGRQAMANRKWPLDHPADATTDVTGFFGDSPAPPPSTYDRLRYLLSPMVIPSLQAAMRKAVHAETLRELTLAAIALKRYQLRHGRLPDNLAALAPEFLRETPRDWFNGQPLHYRPNADGTFLLYSVGEDGKDDGGDPTPWKQTASSSFYFGRDLVWPMPATLEEVRAAEVRKR
jgi:type II secretory pathway pseudopilin PulG